MRVREVFFCSPWNFRVQEVDQFDFTRKLAQNVDVFEDLGEFGPKMAREGMEGVPNFRFYYLLGNGVAAISGHNLTSVRVLKPLNIILWKWENPFLLHKNQIFQGNVEKSLEFYGKSPQILAKAGKITNSNPELMTNSH